MRHVAEAVLKQRTPSRIRCEPFHHHGSTRFDKWLAATAPEKLSCFLGNFYEPFVVVRNCAVTPRFDERYVGYGKNKLAWITSLRAAGFHFYTVPRAFAVHVPHQVSEEHRLWATHSRAIPQKRVVDDMFFRLGVESGAELRTSQRPRKLLTKEYSSTT